MVRDVRLLLAVLWTVYAVGSSLWAWSRGLFDLRYFTFWVYLGQTLLAPLLILGALWTPARRLLLQWLYPLWYGVVWLVFLGSTLMIAVNGDIFLHDTVAATPPGKLTVGVVYLGQILVHVVPLIVVLIYSALEWEALVRVHAHELDRDPHRTASWFPWACRAVGHLLYFFFAPIVPWLVYVALNDINVRYPTAFDTVLSIYVLVVCVVVIQGTLHAALLHGYHSLTMPPPPLGSRVQWRWLHYK